MKLGMPILFEFNSLEENFILAKKLGLDFVELNLNFGYCRQEMEEGKVFDLLKKYDLEATLHFFDEADMGTYDEVVEAYFDLLRKYINYGKDYVKIVNFHNNPGPVVTIAGIKNYMYQKEYDTYIKKLISNFKKAKSILDEFNVKMVIENVDTAKNASFLMDNFVNLSKEGFHFNMDIGHDNIDNDNMFNLMKDNPLILDEMHVHDGNRKTCHLALGEGNIDIKTYKNLAIKNNAYVVIEVKCSEDLQKSIPIFRTI